MDLLVKSEKERAMLLYRRLRRAAALSRCLFESLATLALLSWSSDRLPQALAHCACLLRRLPSIILHPLSAFVLGNAIVVILFARFGKVHPGDDPLSRCASSDVDRPAIFDVSGDPGCLFDPSFSAQPPPELQRMWEEEDVLYEDKTVCIETATAVPSHPRNERTESVPNAGLRLKRTKSEDLSGAVTKKCTKQKLLFRSETDLGIGQKVVSMWEEEEQGVEEGGCGPVVAADDGVEFRQKIEAFISKQLRFIEREEEELLSAEVTM